MSIVRTRKFATYSSSEGGASALTHVQTVLALLGLPGPADAPANDVADDNAIITSALRSHGAEYLLGDAPSTLPQVKQWMSLARTFTSDDLAALNTQLASKTYLVGHAFTVADVAVFVPIRVHCLAALGGYAHVARWFDQVQHVVRRGVFEHVQVTVTAAAAASANAAAAPAAAAATGAPGGGKQPQQQQQQQKQPQPQQQKQQQPQPQKQPAPQPQKGAAAPAAAAGAGDDADKLDPSQLDIRVGHVVKCWNHPDSDKLLCEEIDLGEATVRTIASGIRPHYQAEDLQGRKVCVLANLKDRSLAGFKSQGMVRVVGSKIPCIDSTHTTHSPSSLPAHMLLCRPRCAPTRSIAT